MFRSAFTCLFIFVLLHFTGMSQQVVQLYDGPIPGAVPGKDEEYMTRDSAVLKVSRPTLTAFLPENSGVPAAAVIICPGGGYGSLMVSYEGYDVAKDLSSKGIAAFVLKYRLPSSATMQRRYAGPLQDVFEAIKMIRSRASKYNVDTSKIGVMGFSAGGHLAASSGILSAEQVGSSIREFPRPAFMILVYPVITMDTLRGHKGSTFNLLGEKPGADLMRRFSLQEHVTASTPPAYITVAANDDMLVSSMLLFDAMKKKNAQAELHVYSTGGHGFLRYPPYQEWSRPILNWMKVNGWIGREVVY